MTTLRTAVPRVFSSRAARIRSERRRRRTTRSALCAGLLAAALTVTTLTTLPAQAATIGAPHLFVVAGNGTVSAAWGAVADATGYELRYSTHASMSGAKHLNTTELLAKVTTLKNAHEYWFTVTATRTTVGLSATVTSAKEHAVPHHGDPTKIAYVSAASAGPNQITVHWSGGGIDTKVAAVAGSDSIIEHHVFKSAWMPATTRSITLTVPIKYRAVEGAGSGNPIFVKVVQSNLRTANPVKHIFYNDADDYRLTPSGTWAQAGALPVVPAESVGVTKLKVAELNVNSLPSSASFTKTDQWSARLPRVAKTIEAANADLVATAELSTNRVDPNCITHYPHGGPAVYCNEQYNQLAARLRTASTPLQQTDPNVNAFVHDEQLKYSNAAWSKPGITGGAHLFYNPAVLTMEVGGDMSPRVDLRVTKWPNSLGDRLLSWAKFRINSTGQEFVAAAVHFPVGLAPSVVAARADEAALLAEYLDNQAALPDGQHLPILVMGDLNSDTARSPNAAGTVFMNHGYFDAASASHRYGSHTSTSNGSDQTDGVNPGYPVHVYTHPYPTSRIDYILLKNSPHTYRYQNVLHVSHGKFIPSYQGSDHNLQLATIGIGQPQ